MDVGGDDEQAVNMIEMRLNNRTTFYSKMSDVVDKADDCTNVIQFVVAALDVQDIVGQEVCAIATYSGFRLSKVAYQVPLFYEHFPATI